MWLFNVWSCWGASWSYDFVYLRFDLVEVPADVDEYDYGLKTAEETKDHDNVKSKLKKNTGLPTLQNSI